jgi:hypothetical protein
MSCGQGQYRATREVETYALCASTAFATDNSKKRNASPEDHLDLGIGSPPETALG